MTTPSPNKYPGIFAAVASFFRLLKGLPDNPVFHASKPWRRGWGLGIFFVMNLLFIVSLYLSILFEFPFARTRFHLVSASILACFVPIIMLLLYKELRTKRQAFDLYFTRITGGEIFFACCFWPVIISLLYAPPIYFGIWSTYFYRNSIHGYQGIDVYLLYLIMSVYYVYFVFFICWLFLVNGTNKLVTMAKILVYGFTVFYVSVISCAVAGFTIYTLIDRSSFRWLPLLFYFVFFIIAISSLSLWFHRHASAYYFSIIDKEGAGLIHSLSNRRKLIKSTPGLQEADSEQFIIGFRRFLKWDVLFTLLPLLFALLMLIGGPVTYGYLEYDAAARRTNMIETYSYGLKALFWLPIAFAITIFLIICFRQQFSREKRLALANYSPYLTMINYSFIPITIYFLFFLAAYIVTLWEFQLQNQLNLSEVETYIQGIIFCTLTLIMMTLEFVLVGFFSLLQGRKGTVLFSVSTVSITIVLLLRETGGILDEEDVFFLFPKFLLPLLFALSFLPVLMVSLRTRIGQIGYDFIQENAPACYEQWLAEREVGK